MGPSADMTFMARLRAVVRPARNFLIAQDVSGKPEELTEESSIFYLRAETDGAGTLCAYHLPKREEVVIDTEVTAFQQIGGKDSPLCYLRKEGGSQVLYAYNGTAKTELDRAVAEFHLYPTQASWGALLSQGTGAGWYFFTL